MEKGKSSQVTGWSVSWRWYSGAVQLKVSGKGDHRIFLGTELSRWLITNMETMLLKQEMPILQIYFLVLNEHAVIFF